MSYKSLMLLLFAVFLSAQVAHGNPEPEPAQADTDGPHVFYRGQGIVVKSVIRKGSDVLVETKNFAQRSEVVLTCSLPQFNESFSFKLHDTLSIPPDHYELPARMLVLSDIEGNFAAMKTMLQGVNVMDDAYHWTFGNGHLVLVGDFFDRGHNVTECLWLIYKLEKEAERAGGRVHFILGNHEIMNLAGNTSYVQKKYLENARQMGDGFQYRLWFDQQTELGRWLRTKNAVETIGDYVFCHGGISPELVRSGVAFSDINRLARQYLGKSFETILSPAGRAVFDQVTGIFWFRDGARHKISEEDFTRTLEYAGAKYMVVGHTMAPDVIALYKGRLFCVDQFHEENIRMGFVRTLYVEQGRPYALNSTGEKSSVRHVEPDKGK